MITSIKQFNESISGNDVNRHIKDITPYVHDIPDYYMDNIIKHRRFERVLFDITTLLNTDLSFKEYYESGESRYEDETEYEPTSEELYNEIVVVDGELLDGYNRCSELLRMGETKTYAFVAI